MNIENNNNLTNKNTISVKIGNIKYNLSTNENEEYINGIVKYINNKMDELSSIYDTLNKNSTSFLLVLALNIADDLFKQRQEFNKATKAISEFEKTISSLTNQLTDAKTNAQTLQASNDSKEETISFLEDKLKKLDNQNDNQDNQIESLTKDLANTKKEKDDIISSLQQKLSSITQDKNASLEEKDKLISDLENKISTLLEEKNNISLNINSKLDTVVSEKDKIIFNLKQSLEEKNLIIDNLKDNLNETTTRLSSNDTEDIILEKDIKILELEEEIEKLKTRINS